MGWEKWELGDVLCGARGGGRGGVVSFFGESMY